MCVNINSKRECVPEINLERSLYIFESTDALYNLSKNSRKKAINITLWVCVHACMLSHVQLFATPWTIACQASLSMEIFKQKYRNGLPFPSPRGLPEPEVESVSCISCTGRQILNQLSHWGSSIVYYIIILTFQGHLVCIHS